MSFAEAYKSSGMILLRMPNCKASDGQVHGRADVTTALSSENPQKYPLLLDDMRKTNVSGHTSDFDQSPPFLLLSDPYLLFWTFPIQTLLSCSPPPHLPISLNLLKALGCSFLENKTML